MQILQTIEELSKTCANYPANVWTILRAAFDPLLIESEPT
jgi:hypothetical protein